MGIRIASGWHVAGSPNEGLAAVYTRISETNTDLGVTRQKAICVQRGSELGAVAFRHYSDNSKSASKKDVVREDYDRLINDIRSGQLDGAMVIVYAQDRLARTGLQSEEMLELFELHAIRFVCIADGTDIVPAIDGALIARIRAAVAAEEIRKLKRRLNDALAQNRARGRRHGKVPFGWNSDGSLHPMESMMLEDAAKRVIRGEAMRAIAQEWNEQDLPRPSWVRRTRHGHLLPEDQQEKVSPEWTGKRLQQMLENPALAGIYVHKGQELDVDPQWDAIITRDQHDALIARFTAARTGPASQHLLGGLLFCDRERCKKTVDDTVKRSVMWGVINRSEGYTYHIYRCSNCNHQVKMHPVDDYVQYIAVETLSKIEPADLADPGKLDALTEISAKLLASQQRLAEIDDRYLDPSHIDPIGSQEHAKLTGKMKPIIAKLTSQREVLLAESGERNVLTGLIGPDAAEKWDVVTLEVKREAIRLLMDLAVLPGDRRTPIEDRIKVTPLRPKRLVAVA